MWPKEFAWCARRAESERMRKIRIILPARRASHNNSYLHCKFTDIT